MDQSQSVQIDAKIEDSHKNQSKEKCTDLAYLIIFICFFVFLLVLSVVSFDKNNLRKLGLPLDMNGEVCPQNTPYLLIEQSNPTVQMRICSEYCEPEANQLSELLGGLCFSQRTKYILQMNGEFEHYIQPYLSSLSIISLLSKAMMISFAAGILYSLIIKLCHTLNARYLVVVSGIFAPILLAGFTLYLIFMKINPNNGILNPTGYLWICLTGILLIYTFYAIYSLIMGNQKTRQGQTQQKSYLKQLLIIICCSILSICLFALLVWEYLSVRSSEKTSWTSPNLYQETKQFGYKEGLLIFQALFLMSLNFSICQYILGAYVLVSDNKLLLSKVISRMFLYHFGSVCKAAIVNLIFCIPIHLLQILQPRDRQKIHAKYCYFCCGALLNLSQKYSQPVLAYQASCVSNLDYNSCAKYLQIEVHLNRDKADNTVYRIGAVLFVFSSSLLSMLFLKQKSIELTVWHLILGMMLGTWLGGISSKKWLVERQSQRIRTMCLKNRQFQVDY